MKKLLTIMPLVILLCFTFSCQQGEEVAERISGARRRLERVDYQEGRKRCLI